MRYNCKNHNKNNIKYVKNKHTSSTLMKHGDHCPKFGPFSYCVSIFCAYAVTSMQVLLPSQGQIIAKAKKNKQIDKLTHSHIWGRLKWKDGKKV